MGLIAVLLVVMLPSYEYMVLLDLAHPVCI
jgi:hypothetical protein